MEEKIGTQIGFSHTECEYDETEFDTPNENEALELFNDFVKENKFVNVKITYIEHYTID